MRRKWLVGLSTGLLAAAWVSFALSYASSPPTQGLLGPSLFLGGTFTGVAALLIVRAWTEAEVVPAVTATFFATLLVFVLALLPQGNY